MSMSLDAVDRLLKRISKRVDRLDSANRRELQALIEARNTLRENRGRSLDAHQEKVLSRIAEAAGA